MVRQGIVVVAGIACASVMFFHASAGEARPEYTRRTKKECLYCHPPDSFRLTDAGEYYRDHRTLDGYKPKDKSSYDGSAELSGTSGRVSLRPLTGPAAR